MSEDKAQLLEKVKNLIPINELTTNLQMQLLNRAAVIDCKKSRFVFKQGDKDNYSYYLLDGEVEFYADDQLNSVITSDSDRARYALAQLQPRQFSAKAKTPLKVLQLDRGALDQLLVLSQETTADPTLSSGTEVDIADAEDEEGDWMTQMLQSQLFSRMPMANMHQLFASLEPVEYSKDDVVIQQGDVGEDYFIISEGRCAVSRKPSPNSKDIKLAELGTGDSFGEEALISNAKRNATVKMLTDGVMMRLGKDTFIELIKNPTLNSLKFADASALIEQGAKWLDVRFPNEHQESSIKDSINVPLNSLRLQIDKLDSATQYILYCDTGGRSSTGAFLLAERGFDVSFLEGGLVNNADAVGGIIESAETEKPKKSVDKKTETEVEDDDHVDADVKVEMLNAELETTQIKMQAVEKEKAAAAADEKKKKEFEQNRKKLAEAQKRLEQQKKQAEAEAKKRAAAEEARLKKLKQEATKQMDKEKKQLEEIYNKNALEMEKLQKLKEESEAKMREERERLEQQALEAKKQVEEAERLKREVEESKKQLEAEAEKKKQQEQEREQELQRKAKEKIEIEKRKLAEQYERNSKEFEQLQKEKAAAEAARLAAKEEANKIIEEYKQSHDKTREAEEAKLQAERQKLEEEAQKIRETMKQIQQAKLEAEKIKQAALAEAKSLKEKQQESTSSKEQREQLEEKIQAAEQKATEAEREIEDAAHKEKITESAQQENEADLVKKKKEQESLMAKINEDLASFEDDQESEAPSITQVQMQADMMKRIKQKAQQAKQDAAKKNSSLLDEVSQQLGKNTD